MVQWVRLHAPNAGGPGLIPGWGTGSRMHATTKSLHAAMKIPHAATKTQCSQNKFFKKVGQLKSRFRFLGLRWQVIYMRLILVPSDTLLKTKSEKFFQMKILQKDRSKRGRSFHHHIQMKIGKLSDCIYTNI